MESSPLFGFSEFTTWPWSYAIDLQKYHEHGVKAIEVCEFKLAHNEYGRLSELQHYDLVPSSIQMNVHSIFVDSMAARPEDPADRIKAMKESIAGSAPYLPSGTPFIVITGIAPRGNFQLAIERTVSALAELGEFAASKAMRIAFEPLNPVNIGTDTAVWSLEQGIEIVERVNHPNVGICIDSWNVWQSCDLENVIQRCGKKIFIVQLSDWKIPRSTADRYTLSTGEIPLESMLRAIRKTGYEGAWVVEILSSFHLDGSLWKGNLEHLLQENCEAFDRLWRASAAAAK